MEKMLSGGAGNAYSFEDNLNRERGTTLPKSSSLTYQGLFNDNEFKIESREKDKILSLEYSYGLVNNPVDSKKELYLACMLKSKFDGVGSRKPIDIVICLDRSGSMSLQLDVEKKRSCMDLAKEAILNLKGILNEKDRIGLITFTEKATIIFPLDHLSKIPEFDAKVNEIHPGGGELLYAGLKSGYDLMKEKFNDNKNEKRILMITDMQSLKEERFLQLLKSSSEEGIYTTILGVSLDLNNEFCEVSSKNKGANYFSATKKEHIQKIMIDQFNYNFFPIAFDVNIEFKSGNLVLKKSIGTGFKKLEEENYTQDWKTSNHHLNDTPFKKNVNFLLMYFNRIQKRLPKPVLANFCEYLRYTKKTVTEVNTIHSSEVDAENRMQSGLILMRLGGNENLEAMVKRGCLTLNYKDQEGNCYSDSYPFKLDLNEDKFDSNQNFLEKESIKNGLVLYYYAKFLRRLCKLSNNEYESPSKYNKDNYFECENLSSVRGRIEKFINDYEESELRESTYLRGLIKQFQLLRNN